MFDEYVSVFDLNLPEILKSFNCENFISTNSIIGTRKRNVELFESDFVNILLFDYSFEGQGRIFFRTKKKHDDYKNDIYYSVTSCGESSCGTVKSYGCKNPWEKFVKKFNIGVRDNNLYVDKLAHDDNIFFTRCLDENVIKQELQYKYRAVNKEVRTIYSLYEVKNSGLKLLTTYNEFGVYNLTASSIDAHDNITNYEIVDDVVYRDGGTTYRTLKDPTGKELLFFSPTPFNNNNIPATFDSEECVRIYDKKIIQDTMTKLNILSLSE